MNRQNWLAFFEQEIEPAARQKASAIQRHFLIAGKVISVHFPSQNLSEQLSTAIAHREYFEKSDSALDIFVLRRSDFSADFSPAARYGRPRHEWFFHGDSSVIEVYSSHLRRAFCLINDSQALRYWTISSPFRRIFDWFFTTHGIELVHGAAVGVNGTALLITGPGGSGKSTTAMLSVAGGLSYFSDDYAALSHDGTVHGIYRTLKVLKENPYVIENIGIECPVEGEKRVLLLDNTPAFCLPSSARLRAFLLPHFSPGRRSRVMRYSGDPVQKELSPFALKQSAWITHDQSSILRDVAARNPFFALELGKEMASLPELFEELCESSCQVRTPEG